MAKDRRKEEDPTMARPNNTSKQEKVTEDDDDELHRQYKNLRQEWDAVKQSSRPTRLQRRSSADSINIVKALQLLDNSPRNLMSSLQHRRRSPPDGVVGGAWRVRNNDLAVEEILRERRAAVADGKLKGRRLFEDEGEEEEITCREVRSVCSYEDGEKANVESKEGLLLSPAPCLYYSSSSSSSSSFVCHECMEREVMKTVGVAEEEKVEVENREEKNASVDDDDGSGYSTRLILVIIGWLAVGLLFGIISLMRRLGDLGRGSHEVTLVPT